MDDRLFYVSRGGENFGPYSVDDMTRMIAEGQIQGRDLVCPVGAQQWVPAATLFQTPAERYTASAGVKASQRADLLEKAIPVAAAKYAGISKAMFYCLLLAVFPAILGLTVDAGSEDMKDSEILRKRHGVLMLFIVKARHWWPFLTIGGVVGLTLLSPKAGRVRRDIKKMKEELACIRPQR